MKDEPNWTAAVITAPVETIDFLSGLVHELGSAGAVIRDIDDGLSKMTVYFDAARARSVESALEAGLSRAADAFPDLPAPTVKWEAVRTEDWAVMWKDSFTPTPVGERLLVTPPWRRPDAGDRFVVIIEPAAAFGTGTHETTRSCLALLEAVADELGDRVSRSSVLDVGCGSGILAVAAKRLGFSTVMGIDNDPIAIESARRNAELNDLADGTQWAFASVDTIAGSWDLVTANLDPLTLETHYRRLSEAARCGLIVSGVPTDQWERAAALFVESGLILQTEIIDGEWAAGLFRAPDA